MRLATLLVMLLSLAWASSGGAMKLYLNDTATAKVQRADLDGMNLEDLVVSPPTTAPIMIAVDPVNGKVYWTDQQPNNSRVMRADLDGSNPETLVAHPTPVVIGFPFGVAVDPLGGKFYWTDIFAGVGRLYRANFDGTNVQAVVVAEFIYAVALDLVNSKVYWSEFAATSKIWRANLDGTSPEDLLTTGIGGGSQVQGLALDIPGGKMYFTDVQAKQISRANLDGSNPEVLVSPVSDPVGIALDGAGKMYWGDPAAAKIQRANLDGSNIEDVLTSADGLIFPRGVAVDPGPATIIPALSPLGVGLMGLLLISLMLVATLRARTAH